MVYFIAQEHIGVDTIYLQPSKAGSIRAPGQSMNGDTLAAILHPPKLLPHDQAICGRCSIHHMRLRTCRHP